jgi:hypothetical protein
MSMTMRSNSLTASHTISQNQRTMSINNNSAMPINRQTSINSRTHSLNNSLRQQQKIIQQNSRNNSRSNSLTSNTPHTKIIKTTKEKDSEGRTKSITTTTIEKRGDVKIVRTTIIQPSISQPINEDAELEELAELQGFDHDHRLDGLNNDQFYHDNMYNDYDSDQQQEYDYYLEEEVQPFHQDPYKNDAAHAAAAALNIGRQQKSNQQYPQNQQRKNLQRQRIFQRNALSPVLYTQSSPNYFQQRQQNRRSEVRFSNDSISNEHIGSDFDMDNRSDFTYNENDFVHQNQQIVSATKQQRIISQPNREQEQQPLLSKDDILAAHNKAKVTKIKHTLAKAVTLKEPVEQTPPNTPQRQQVATNFDDDQAYRNNDEIIEGQNDDIDDAIVVIPEEGSPNDSFKTRAQKRLSEIQEVTELYDDENFMEEPILNPVGVDHQTDRKPVIQNKNKNNKNNIPSIEQVYPQNFVNPILPNKSNNTVSSDDYFVEAQEEIINDSHPGTTNNSHSYRNLMFASSRSTEQEAPKSTVPSNQSEKFPLKHNGQQNHQDIESYVSNEKVEKQPKMLKSALKNSSHSLVSPTVSDSNYQHFSSLPSDHAVNKNHQYLQMSNPQPAEPVRRELSPDEMYSIALKAAEKKVYGDRLNRIPTNPGDADNTNLNTLINTDMTVSTSNNLVPLSGVSQPGEPYQSNAAGMGFKVHSLRGNSRNSKRIESMDGTKLKKMFKSEQKQQKKQWEQERKAAVESGLLSKVAKKVEKEVEQMPVDPNVELNILQQQQNEMIQQHQAELQIQQQKELQAQQLTEEEQRPEAENIQVQQQIQSAVVEEPVMTPQSPSKLKLKIFRLNKKKTTSPKKGKHKKNASIISQETNVSTQSGTNKKKLFSFGFGTDNSFSNVNKTTGLDVETKSAVVSDTTNNIPAQESIFSEPLPETSPDTSNNIITIPENEVVQNNNNNTVYPAPHIPGFKNSANNLSKIGTYNSSNVESEYTNNNVDSINVTNSSKVASGNNVNGLGITEFSKVKQQNDVVKENLRENVNVAIEANNGVESVRVASNVSSSQKKSDKGGRKFMKFFNL